MTRDARLQIFVIDRREENTLVIVSDDDRSIDVPVTHVPKSCRAEGAVLRVPIGTDGVPQWEKAKRDRAEERRRLAELRKRTDRLRRSDPGGDVVL